MSNNEGNLKLFAFTYFKLHHTVGKLKALLQNYLAGSKVSKILRSNLKAKHIKPARSLLYRPVCPTQEQPIKLLYEFTWARKILYTIETAGCYVSKVLSLPIH
jgi:hypothetical protein